MVSSSFRVTNAGIGQTVTANMQATLARLQKIQSQVSSNRRIQRPSDDPVGTISALRLRSDLGRSEQIGRNIEDAQAWLGSADSALNDVVTQVQRVRDLALQAQNGSLGPTELAAIGDELDQIHETLIGLANTRYGDRSIFAGTAVGAAFDAAGDYVGTSMAIERTVGPGQRLQINANGDEVFGANGSNLFDTVADLSTAVRAGNSSGIDAAITTLDTQTHTVQTRLAEVGARAQRVTVMKDQNDSGTLTRTQNLSQVEDVDLAKAIMDMQMQQVAYQAAIATTARVIQPSLLDFLK